MDEILKNHLLDLLCAFDSKSLPVILGGGYGLFLRQLQLQETDDRTMVEKRAWPAPRSTEDLDVFLSLSIVSDTANMTAVASIIKDLGYQPVEGAEFWQFKKYITETAFVKIDLLSGPIPDSLNSKVKRNAHRIRPKGKSIGLHAHATDEALVLEDALCAIAVAGTCSNEKPYESKIMVPHPFYIHAHEASRI